MASMGNILRFWGRRVRSWNFRLISQIATFQLKGFFLFRGIMILNHPNWISTVLPFSLFGGASFLSFSQRQTFQKKRQAADHDPPSSGSDRQICQKNKKIGKKHVRWVDLGVFPQNGWFIMENPIKMDDLGGKPTIFGNTYLWDAC